MYLSRLTHLVLPALVLAASLATASPPQGEKKAELKMLRVLMAIDTGSDDLREDVKRDRENMEELLRTHIPRERYKIDEILDGSRLNRTAVLKHYENLKTGPNEALLFFYAGHGALTKDNVHCLFPQQKERMSQKERLSTAIPRLDVRKAMEAKGAGLVVLLTDCCSTRLPLKLDKIVKRPAVGKVVIHPAMNHLLYQHRGTVDITAAAEDEGSWGDSTQGGIFTRSLVRLLENDLKALDRDGDRFLTWKEFFPLLEKETNAGFQRLAENARGRGQEIPQTTQKPRSYSLGEPAPAGAATQPVPQSGTYAVVSLQNDTGVEIKYRYRWTGEKDWQMGTIAVGKKIHHWTPLKGNTLPQFEIEATHKFTERGELKPAKWTGKGDPAYTNGEEYKITGNK